MKDKTSNAIRLAIFDFDGTLTEGHLWLGIAKHHLRKKVRRFPLVLYFVLHMPLYIGAKLHIYSEEKNRSKWGEDLTYLFKGFSVKQYKEAFEWVSENYFLPLMRKDMLGVLEQHKNRGEKVVLLSGMYTDFLEIIGRKIGADCFVGTRMEVKNNVCTGKIVQPLCFGENKAVFLKRYITENSLSVDLAGSWAYADSFYDSPVFELVGNPVATYPDRRLLELASERKWRVIGSPE